MTTKERIVYESMKLFSVNGYKAVTIRAIADRVGVGNSALYKHFESKQAIFDEIVRLCRERYINKCSNAVNVEIRGVEQVKQICFEMFRYQTHDEWIVMFRRILLIEQFANPKMAEIYKEFFLDIPLHRQEEIFRELIKCKFMKNRAPDVLALELYSPFYMYHAVKRDEEELMRLFEGHVEYFFENNIMTQQDCG